MSNLKMVQDLVVKGKTIKEIVETKHARFENGWEVDGDKVIFWHSPTVKLADNPLRSPVKYTWKVNDGKITAIGGKASTLTPEYRKKFD